MKNKFDKLTLEELAHKLATESVVTRALERWITQVLEAVYEDRIAPLERDRSALTAALQAAREAMDMGLRLVDYYANNRRFFEGSGTPATFDRDARAAIAQIDAALGGLETEKSPHAG